MVVSGVATVQRCYSCGDHPLHTVPCQEGVVGVEVVCHDIINNKGCITQKLDGGTIMINVDIHMTPPYSLFVLEVIKRGCWLDGTNMCRKNKEAEVCSCSGDLCNDDHIVNNHIEDDIVENVDDVQHSLVDVESITSANQEESSSDRSFQGFITLVLSAISLLYAIFTS